MTPRDEEILTVLCSKVRFFSLEQIGRTWWTEQPREIRRARERMLTLAKNAWIKPTTLLARPLLNLVGPIFEWHPGRAGPSFRAVSKALRRRWKLPARKVEVFLATPRASAIFGGTTFGMVKNLCQATHDLHVAETFLFYRKNLPDLARLWVGEDSVISKRGAAKRPDAFLRDGQGNILRVVEFGGAYKPDRVQALHEHCSKQKQPYEIW